MTPRLSDPPAAWRLVPPLPQKVSSLRPMVLSPEFRLPAPPNASSHHALSSNRSPCHTVQPSSSADRLLLPGSARASDAPPRHSLPFPKRHRHRLRLPPDQYTDGKESLSLLSQRALLPVPRNDVFLASSDTWLAPDQ